MRPGTILRVASNDPMAVLDIPSMARDEGHQVVYRHIDGAYATFWIKRFERPVPPGDSASNTP